MRGTLEITNNYFDDFPMTLSRILHKPRNHANNKRDVRSTVSEINKDIDQLSIKSGMDFGIQIIFSQLNSRLKRSSTHLTVGHLKII